MKNEMRMIKGAIGLRCLSCFVGPPDTFLAPPATINLFDNPELTFWVLLLRWNEDISRKELASERRCSVI